MRYTEAEAKVPPPQSKGNAFLATSSSMALSDLWANSSKFTTVCEKEMGHASEQHLAHCVHIATLNNWAAGCKAYLKHHLAKG